MAVLTLTVNGDGTTTSGFASEGGTYTRLQSDDADTTRLYTAVANDVRQVTLTDTSGLTGVTIQSLTVYAKYRSLDPVANTFQIGVRAGGTDYWSANKDTVTSTSYILFSNTWTTNPNTSAAWTISDLDAVQAGIKKINAVGGACTYMYAEVNYGIALDAKTQNLTTGTTSISFSHTDGSGGNRLLVATFLIRNDVTAITGTPTYGGVNLTLAKRQTDATNGLSAEIWYLIAPATGANTLAATLTATDDTRTIVSTYTGVMQTSFLDQTGGAGAASTVTITPTIDNELIVAGEANEDGTAPTAGSGETLLYGTDEGTWATGGEYAIQTTATAQAMNFATWAAAQGCIAAASFKMAITSASTPNKIYQVKQAVKRGAYY